MEGGILVNYNYINLTFESQNIGIEGVELPNEIILSLKTRGKRSINHRFNTLNQEIEILCSICKNWNSLYVLEKDKNSWRDINDGAYWISTKQHTNLNYYSNSCYSCYQNNKKKKNSQKQLPKDTKEVILIKPEGQPVECGKLSSNNDRIQQTIALSKDNDWYIKLNALIHGERKNDFINAIIDNFRRDNPRNLS